MVADALHNFAALRVGRGAACQTRNKVTRLALLSLRSRSFILDSSNPDCLLLLMMMLCVETAGGPLAGRFIDPSTRGNLALTAARVIGQKEGDGGSQGVDALRRARGIIHRDIHTHHSPTGLERDGWRHGLAGRSNGVDLNRDRLGQSDGDSAVVRCVCVG